MDFTRPHSDFWFPDGSLIVQNETDLYKLHESLLTRHSESLSAWITSSTETYESLRLAKVPADFSSKAQYDFHQWLRLVYGDELLHSDSSFYFVASIFRATSPHAADVPVTHELAKTLLINLFPSGASPFVHPPYLQEAIALALDYDIRPIQKGLFYSLMTSSDIDVDDMSAPTDENQRLKPSESTNNHKTSEITHLPRDDHTGTDIKVHPPIPISPAVEERCAHLMSETIAHFTPILFTPATTSHMACTDVFADTWMDLVIQPALDSDGVYKPLETLQKIIEIDWASHGLCDSCCVEKREEWKGEQEEIWSRMDNWL